MSSLIPRRGDPLAAPLAAQLAGGGTDGNQQLTAAAGAMLVVMLGVLGLTLLRMHQLIWVHLFVGLALIGPIVVKLASTGYRFVRYYARNPEYRRKGPPPLALRLLGPPLIASTITVLASGIILMVDGPARPGSWLTIHKASFVVWGVLIAVHVLGHLQHMPHALTASGAGSGRVGRVLALSGGVVAGLLLAALLIPDFAAWTGPMAFHGNR